MKYCSECGAKVSLRIPEGDDRARFVCDGCAVIHYENPRMVVGTLPVMGDRILLCRRAIEPAREKWTLPAGWLENGETLSACAERETFEEALARVEELQPYTLVNLPFIRQVYFIFRARLVSNDFGPGPESLEVKLFTAGEIPWDDLAFSAVRASLQCFCADLEAGVFPFHLIDIETKKG